MMRLLAALLAIVPACAAASAQDPLPLGYDFPPPASVPLLHREPEHVLLRRPGWYGAAGVLVAPPLMLSLPSQDESWQGQALLPIPAPFSVLGYRRRNDVSWQASYLLVPLYHPNLFLFDHPLRLSTTGLDFDRISTDRSLWPEWDMRWQVGLRTVGIGFAGIPIPVAMGPHAGLRLERSLTERWLLHAWGDVGLLPSWLEGYPLINLRSELGLTWRSPRRPAWSVRVAAYQETIGFGPAAFMTPGVMTRIGWNY